MADPAELIPTQKAVWLLRHLNCRVEDGSIMLAKSALAELAALTPPPSAEDVAVLLAFQAAAIDAYTQHDGPSELDTKREQLRAAVLSRMAGTPTWRDIESAPKDGTKVLLWKHGWEYAPVAYWGRIDGEDGKFGAWLFENEDLCLGIDSGCLGWNEDVADGCMPTHWTMPLPTAPETPR